MLGEGGPAILLWPWLRLTRTAHRHVVLRAVRVTKHQPVHARVRWRSSVRLAAAEDKTGLLCRFSEASVVRPSDELSAGDSIISALAGGGLRPQVITRGCSASLSHATELCACMLRRLHRRVQQQCQSRALLAWRGNHPRGNTSSRLCVSMAHLDPIVSCTRLTHGGHRCGCSRPAQRGTAGRGAV